MVARDERRARRARRRDWPRNSTTPTTSTRLSPVNKGNYDEVINGTIAAYRAKRPPHIVQIYERGFMTMLLSDAVVPGP